VLKLFVEEDNPLLKISKYVAMVNFNFSETKIPLPFYSSLLNVIDVKKFLQFDSVFMLCARISNSSS